MKTRLSQSRQIKTQTPTGTTVRFCATVEPEVLEDAHQVAKLSGFKFSFSAYVNDLLKRDVEQRRAHMATCARA